MCAAPKSQVLSQEIVMSCLTLSQVICYGTKLGVFSWLYSFSRMIVVGFLLGPRPMNPQALGHFSSVWSRFHLIEGALNPIKTWLATARIFVLLCTNLSFSQIIGFIAECYWWLIFSSGSIQRTLPTPWTVWVKLLGYQLDFFIFSNGVLPSGYGK